MGASVPHLKAKKREELQQTPDYPGIPPLAPKDWSASWEDASCGVTPLPRFLQSLILMGRKEADAKYEPKTNKQLVSKPAKPGWKWNSKNCSESAKNLEAVWNKEARGQAFVERATAIKILQSLKSRPLSENTVLLPFPSTHTSVETAPKALAESL